MPAWIRNRTDRGVLVVEISGTADAGTSEQLDALLSKPDAGAPAALLFDLSRCEFFPSHGWGTLLAASKRITKLGGKAAVCGAHGQVAAAYQALGAGAHLPHHRDVAAGIKALAPPTPSEAPAAASRPELGRVISLTVPTKTRGKIEVLLPTGTVDSTTAQILDRHLHDKLAAKTPVVLSLAKTDYVTSAGWGTVIQAAHEFRKKGVPFVLVELHEGVRLSFSHLEVGSFVASFRSEDDGLSFISQSLSGGEESGEPKAPAP